MNFQILMDGLDIPSDVTAEIQRLLQIKTSTAEMGEGPRIAVLESFLDAQISWAKAQADTRIGIDQASKNRRNADELFRNILQLAWNQS
jgi:predicted nucleotidyltransferase